MSAPADLSMPAPFVDPAGVPIEEAFAHVLDPAARPNPYPFFARLRDEPVSRQSDGTWVVARYADIARLLHDPRISSDLRHSGAALEGFDSEHNLIALDPPDHDRLRGAVMPHFTPDRIRALTVDAAQLADEMLDRAGTSTGPAGERRIDIVDELAYPLPVTFICRLLGVPREDESRFHVWADAIVRAADGAAALPADEQEQIRSAVAELTEYLTELASSAREGLVAGLVHGTDHTPPLTGKELTSTARLLLVAGHETSVNLITNGMLTLLRHPDVLERFRGEPELVVPMVEELVRYEPSVQFRYRSTLADVEVGDRTIPAGSTVAFALAAGSRDPAHTPDPDRFVPDRSPNEHFGFGAGIHYCIGAPLARMEVHAVLPELARRLVNPRLVSDPPPYRPGAALRGPLHLWLDVDGLRM